MKNIRTIGCLISVPVPFFASKIISFHRSEGGYTKKKYRILPGSQWCLTMLFNELQ